MRVAITGATGLIGRAVAAELRGAGHEIVAISRSAGAARRLFPVEAADVVVWDPMVGRIDAARLEGVDAVIHLAGETIAGLWTGRKRARIRESRVRGTELLAHTLAGLSHPPRALLSASAIGYYGDRPPDTPLDEDSPPGSGFMAETGVAWEAATRAAEEAGIRTTRMRFGLVMDPRGGMLAAILPIFRLGLGGRLGSGRQVMSWIALDDAVRAILHILGNEGLAGPVNVVAPNPVSNREFTRMLGRVLRRPAPFIVPAFALRLLPGDMAREMLLGGARVVPARLHAAGFQFTWPELEPALRGMLGSDRKR